MRAATIAALSPYTARCRAVKPACVDGARKSRVRKNVHAAILEPQMQYSTPRSCSPYPWHLDLLQLGATRERPRGSHFQSQSSAVCTHAVAQSIGVNRKHEARVWLALRATHRICFFCGASGGQSCVDGIDVADAGGRENGAGGNYWDRYLRYKYQGRGGLGDFHRSCENGQSPKNVSFCLFCTIVFAVRRSWFYQYIRCGSLAVQILRFTPHIKPRA